MCRLLSKRGLSPSSRRAWIEILPICVDVEENKVALLAEGVDRNIIDVAELNTTPGRPPRGGRG